jgi:hypothetical protein
MKPPYPQACRAVRSGSIRSRRGSFPRLTTTPCRSLRCAFSCARVRRRGEKQRDARGGDQHKQDGPRPLVGRRRTRRGMCERQIKTASRRQRPANAGSNRRCSRQPVMQIRRSAASKAVAFKPLEAVGPKSARWQRADVAGRLGLRGFGWGSRQVRARSFLLDLNGGGRFGGWPGKQHSLFIRRRPRDGGERVRRGR